MEIKMVNTTFQGIKDAFKTIENNKSSRYDQQKTSKYRLKFYYSRNSNAARCFESAGSCCANVRSIRNNDTGL